MSALAWARPARCLRRSARASRTPRSTSSRCRSSAPPSRTRCASSSGPARCCCEPASQGTGVIAGGSVRAVVEAAGVRDILSKSLGSTNPVNVVRATLEGLRSLHSAEELGARRGKVLHSFIPGQPSSGILAAGSDGLRAAQPRRARTGPNLAGKPSRDAPQERREHQPGRPRATVRALGPAPHRRDRRAAGQPGRSRPGACRRLPAEVAESLAAESRRGPRRQGGQGRRPSRQPGRRPTREAPRPEARSGLHARTASASAAASPAGKGKTAGRGTKGQKSRAGGTIPSWFEGGQTPAHIRLPKLHGFKHRFRIEYQVVNVGRISEYAEAGRFGSRARQGSPDHQQRSRCARPGLISNDRYPVKVLGHGDVTVKLFVAAEAFTKSATREDRGCRRLRPGRRPIMVAEGRDQAGPRRCPGRRRGREAEGRRGR